MKVLLVKLSSLGDVVHTLPVVQDILAAHPGAQIDWVVEKSFAPVLSPLLGAGLRRVIPCELRRWRKAPFAAATRAEWKIFKSQLQAEHYDAVIDLQGLTKSALVARLARVSPTGKRYALANQTDGSGYEAPTRWVADVAVLIEPHIHAMQRSRVLSARALGYSLSPAWSYGLNPASANEGRAKFATKTVAFVHGTSREDKQWPLENWTALGRCFMAQGYRIALPHGSADELTTSQLMAAALSREDEHRDVVVWPRLSLDALTLQLAQCAGVIGVDSGVSHIAVALDLPHVQIYNFDTAWRTGPLPGTAGVHQVSVYARPTPTAEAVWDAWLGCQQASTQVQNDV